MKVQGDWEWHWSVIGASVLRVEKGDWAEAELRFVAAETWPTPKSGIKIKAVRFEFREGLVYAFGLDTRTRPAGVVSYEARTQIPASQP